MIFELDDLNKKFFGLLAELDRYSETMSVEQFDFMKKAIYEQYEKEYKLLALQCSIDPDRAMFRAERERDALVPWRRHTFFWFWRRKKWKRNVAALLIEKRVSYDSIVCFLNEVKALLAMQASVVSDDEDKKTLKEMQDRLAELTDDIKDLLTKDQTPRERADSKNAPL